MKTPLSKRILFERLHNTTVYAKIVSGEVELIEEEKTNASEVQPV